MGTDTPSWAIRSFWEALNRVRNDSAFRDLAHHQHLGRLALVQTTQGDIERGLDYPRLGLLALPMGLAGVTSLVTPAAVLIARTVLCTSARRGDLRDLMLLVGHGVITSSPSRE